MKRIYALFNPHSGNHTGEARAAALRELYPAQDLTLTDMTTVSDYAAYLADITPEDTLLICGGDGTLNRFVNDTEGLTLPEDIQFFPAGTGNDFLRDLGLETSDKPVAIGKYLQGLPVTEVLGKKYRFLNNVGFGIDGYCCEVGDRLRDEGTADINYTSIAIKGLLFHYAPTDAVVTVDGVEHKFKKVWLAPTMNGRYYGGGMMAAPEQDRLDPEGRVSVMIFYGKGRLATLMAFPSIFKGEHVKKTNMVQVLTGHRITVRFDGPRTVQVDGETVPGVTRYTVDATARRAKTPDAAEAVVG